MEVPMPIRSTGSLQLTGRESEFDFAPCLKSRTSTAAASFENNRNSARRCLCNELPNLYWKKPLSTEAISKQKDNLNG